MLCLNGHMNLDQDNLRLNNYKTFDLICTCTIFIHKMYVICQYDFRIYLTASAKFLRTVQEKFFRGSRSLFKNWTLTALQVFKNILSTFWERFSWTIFMNRYSWGVFVRHIEQLENEVLIQFKNCFKNFCSWTVQEQSIKTFFRSACSLNLTNLTFLKTILEPLKRGSCPVLEQFKNV